MPWWSEAVGGVTPAAARELPAGYDHGWRCQVPLAEMPTYLYWLVKRFNAEGGRIEVRRIERLEAECARADVVINCTGLGSRTLVPDYTVVPVRGQLAIVSNPGLNLSIRDDDHPDGRAYVHPRRHDCVLGGTDDVGYWDTTPDMATAAAIIRRCIELEPQIADAKVLRHVVGLRPVRPTVRIERTESASGTVLIHNYGHGGAGVTLSWGCADDVLALMEPNAADSIPHT